MADEIGFMNPHASTTSVQPTEPASLTNCQTVNVNQVPLPLSVKLAGVRMTLGQLRSLKIGSILPVKLPLNNVPLEVRINQRTVGSGITVHNGASLGVQLTHIGGGCRSETPRSLPSM
jgi:flagellar motor switch/type III secretory pathway protein FliN